jgi:hypothetical protein
MDPARALGLWRSSFGPVKIENDLSRGQPGSGSVMGVWVYDRDGQEVIGYFAGSLRGNVLDFTWQEPASPAPLQGAGYLLFDGGGTRFSGRWWTASRDRGAGGRDAARAAVSGRAGRRQRDGADEPAAAAAVLTGARRTG